MKFSNIATIATTLFGISLADVNYVYVTQTRQVTKYATVTFGGQETVAPVATEPATTAEIPAPSESTWIFSTNVLGQDIVFTSVVNLNQLGGAVVNLFNEHVIVQSGDSFSTKTLLVQANPTTLLTSTLGDDNVASESAAETVAPIASVATTLTSSQIQPTIEAESATSQEETTVAPSSTSLGETTVAPQPTLAKTTSKQQPTTTSSTKAAATTTSSSSGLDSFAQSILDAHNQKRALHGVPALSWDQTLSNYAQNYANKYDCSGSLSHSGGPYGENLAVGYKDGVSALNAWYDEIKDYTWNNQFSSATGHFTAVVWKSTSKLGCANKQCGSGLYVICSYSDSVPNLVGAFAQNILNNKSSSTKTIQSDEDHMPKYIIENGLRKVVPYHMNYQTHVKQRWVGKTIIDVYTNDFGETKQGIIQDINEDKLYIVNNVGVTLPSVTIKGLNILNVRKIENKDVIYHTKHKHEPMIPWVEKIPIVFENDEILVVDKPSGIPTHPSGNYMYNSLSEMIKEQLKLNSIWTCHRLDKATSGILILCKARESAIKYSNLLLDKKNNVTKTYLARVKGEFPVGVKTYTCPIFIVNMNGYLAPGDLTKLPTNTTTIFERIRYNKELDESIVKCIPVTGKFHQIRIHLRNLGYAISNDDYYRPDDSLPSTYIEKSNIEKGLYKLLFTQYPQFASFSGESNPETINLLDLIKWDTNTTLVNRLFSLKSSHSQILSTKKSSICSTCYRPIFDEDMNGNSNIYLHALSFEYDDHKFETEVPNWANI
ncbi:hypothetical protein KGF54_004469 [Candida jiufengensis]|uniref:uncharacterized protein n=1 Tax=Candida jiufengensis TaxID=497108 RepID=UPI00222556AD|nr:uncharacterized protein KGF54_004469 [Candida jiufengensis]KAI5951395.1 hypothetical protein KGF54_004469 [Candida jiufengensis]